MSFSLSVGDRISNRQLVEIFKCGNMGGMRRSKKTGTLVIISDETKGLYQDVWKDGILHYTGMGKLGDQVLEGNQNKTLYDSNNNGIEVHLFEVIEKSIYTYRGIVNLVKEPYRAMQLDENGTLRNVWIFPLKPVKNEIEFEDTVEKEIVKLTNLELNRRFRENHVDKKPKTKEATVYYRDPYLKEMVKRIAEGKCQYCCQAAPFKDKNSQPYLEEHHVKRLADGGTDTIDNVVAICPNCHRKMHVLNDKIDMIVLEGIAQQNVKMLQRLLKYDEAINKECKEI